MDTRVGAFESPVSQLSQKIWFIFIAPLEKILETFEKKIDVPPQTQAYGRVGRKTKPYEHGIGLYPRPDGCRFSGYEMKIKSE